MDIIEEYAALGLVTMPLVDKAPFRPWEQFPLGKEWRSEYPAHDVGVLCGDALTVVDVDDRALADTARAVFGETPIEVETRRGVHLWYRGAGEKRDIHWGGLPIDILAGRHVIVAPPSANRVFAKGSLADFPSLPTINSKAMVKRKAVGVVRPSEKPIEEMFDGDGRRVRLFKLAIPLGLEAESQADLFRELATVNQRFGEPLAGGVVEEVAAQIWVKRLSGELFGKDGKKRIITLEADHLRLRTNPDAYVLLQELRLHHWTAGEEFFLSNGIRERFGWTIARFNKAWAALVAFGDLVILNKGGRFSGDRRTAVLRT